MNPPSPTLRQSFEVASKATDGHSNLIQPSEPFDKLMTSQTFSRFRQLADFNVF